MNGSSGRTPGGRIRKSQRTRSAGTAPRILLTADTVGGVWTYALELARALSVRGSDVALATMGAPPDAGQRAAADRVDGLALFSSDFRLEWMDDPWEDVARAGEWLLRLERSWDPDIVHLNGYAHGGLPFRAPTLVVGHSCVVSWWAAVHGEEAPGRYDRYRKAVGRGLAGADAVAAPTRAMLDALERHYGSFGSGRVIPNGRSAERFRPASKEPVVFGCGRLWDDGKNLRALERAAPALPWPVEVAGSLEHPEGGERRPEHVRCPGVLPPEQIARRMGRAAICAHPARYEPFGLVPLEAALSGTALVLGDLPSLREVWGEAALYVEPDDHAALRDTLLRVIGDEDLRHRLGRAARSRALDLTPARMADGYLELYRSLRTRPASSGDGGGSGGRERRRKREAS